MKIKNLSRQFWVFCLALLWFLPSQAQTPNLVTGGLFAHYPFDGTPEDVSGNGNHATLNGSPAYVDGYRGKGVRLDNSTALYGASRGQFAKFPNLTCTNLSVAFWSKWIQPGHTRNAPVYYVGGGDTLGRARYFWLLYLPNGNFRPGYNNEDLDGMVTREISLAQPVWHHLAVTLSERAMISYLDGVAWETNSFPAHYKPDFLNALQYLGAHQWGFGETEFAASYNGVVDDVYIFTRPLASKEVSALYLGINSFSPPRRAKATGVLVNGFLVEVTVTDGGGGYTNTPNVTISGGGGAGATAFSTILNGSVDRVFILNSGSGFTSIPTITLEPPYSVPSLSIAVATVSVTMHVVEGRKYQLESSGDFQSWKPAGATFTAEKPEVVQFFDVSQTGQYFRLREVP